MRQVKPWVDFEWPNLILLWLQISLFIRWKWRARAAADFFAPTNHGLLMTANYGNDRNDSESFSCC